MGDKRAENDVPQKLEKRITKKLKKGKTDEESALRLLENFGRNQVTEHEHRSQIKDITEISKNYTRSKKKKANKDVKDAEVVDLEKDSTHEQLSGVYGEDDNLDGRNHERTKRKKRKIGACDLPRYEVGKLEANEFLAKPVEKKVKSGRTAKKERKQQKLMEIHTVGDIEREYEGREECVTCGDNIEASVTECVKWKKRKTERMNKEDDYCLESQGNCDGAMKSKIYEDSEENKTIENERNSKRKYESVTENHPNDFAKKVKRKKKKAVEDEFNESALQQNILSEENKIKQSERNCKNKNDDFPKTVKRKKKKAVECEHNDGDFSALQQNLSISHDLDGEKEYNTSATKAKQAVDDLDDPTPSKSNKKVSFSGQVEVFSLPDDSDTKTTYDEEDLVRGKRFTSEENEIVKKAVYSFIQDHNLGEDGLDMVLNSKNHPELKGCWKEIGAAIPYRPYTAVYYRAQVIFRRGAIRKWTQEEYDMVLKYQELHGNEWKALADELGKHRWHVKDTWRRIKLRNMNKGQWSQKEYQNLFDLVNLDLQQKISEEKISKHGMLRDNICWTAISDKLSTRAQANCCIKWYKQLTSPMVAEGLWADTDDYRMLRNLYRMDAGCMEDVDWDSLLDHRSGELCRKRWNQMFQHLGKYGLKPFSEQVDVLAKRYCPELLEVREIWDNKPRVP